MKNKSISAEKIEKFAKELAEDMVYFNCAIAAEHSFPYFAMKIIREEINRPLTHRECLAIVEVLNITVNYMWSERTRAAVSYKYKFDKYRKIKKLALDIYSEFIQMMTPRVEHDWFYIAMLLEKRFKKPFNEKNNSLIKSVVYETQNKMAQYNNDHLYAYTEKVKELRKK